MNHREAAEHLPDFVGGRCDQLTRNNLASHIETCPDCRAWVETHDFLANALGGLPRSEHPSSEVLALYALQTEEFNGPDNSANGRHIEGCAVCRRDIEMVQSAVLEARPDTDRARRSTYGTPVHTWWRIAAAACVASVVLWSVISTESRHPDRFGSQPSEISASFAGSEVTAPIFQDEELSEMEIEGVNVIEADGRLTLSQVKIRDGAVVTIIAGNGVAFADGFHVESQARLVVGSSSDEPVREILRAGSRIGDG